MSLEIFDKNGRTTNIWIHKFDFTDIFMGHSYISADIDLPSQHSFDPGTYVMYNEEKYSIETIHSTKKEGVRRYTVSLTFYGITYELERVMMRDLIPYDNGVVYPTPMMIEFTGKINYLTERIQSCLDAFYGKNVWVINIASSGEDLEKNISLQNVSCWEALTLAYNEYGLYFYVDGRVVTITDVIEDKVNYGFEVGYKGGLYSVEETPKSDSPIVTKLRVYGGTRNLDFSYPKLPSYTGSVLQPDFILTPLRLMLPDFKTDGKTDYLLTPQEDIDKYGLREGVAVFDDIYPTIEGMTNERGDRMDQLREVSISGAVNKNAFTLYTWQMNFQKPDGSFMKFEDLLTNKPAKIVMKTGQLQGYSFKVLLAFNSWVESAFRGYSYQLECEKIKLSDSVEEFYIPNDKFKMAAGDEFVFIDVTMPVDYVLEAERRLENRGLIELEKLSTPERAYSALVSEELIKAKGIDLRAGKEVFLADFNKYILIQSMTVHEGDSSLPKYDLSLDNKPTPDIIQKMQGQISSLEAKSQNDFSASVDANTQYRNKLDKSVWDKALEIKKDPKGIEYLWGKLPFIGVSSIVAYGGDSPAVPNIWQSIPLDGNTLTWTNGKLTVVGGPGGKGASTIYIGGTAYESVDGVVRLPDYPSLSNYVTLNTVQVISSSKWLGKTELNPTGLIKFYPYTTPWSRGMFYSNVEGTLQKGEISMSDDGTHGEPTYFKVSMYGEEILYSDATTRKFSTNYAFWVNDSLGIVIHTPNVYYARFVSNYHGIVLYDPPTGDFNRIFSTGRIGIGTIQTPDNFNLNGSAKWLEMPGDPYDYNFTDMIVRNGVDGEVRRVNNAIVPAKYNHQILNYVDLTGLDENMYYPIIIGISPYAITTIEIKNALNTNKPSWTTHSAGFSISLVLQMRGSAWGTISVESKVLYYVENHASVRILGRIGQGVSYSNAVIWLRGGAHYNLGGNYEPNKFINPRGEWSDPSGWKVGPETPGQQPSDPLDYVDYAFSRENARIRGSFTVRGVFYVDLGIVCTGNATVTNLLSVGGDITSQRNISVGAQLHVTRETYLNSTVQVAGVANFNSYIIVSGDIHTNNNVYSKGNVIAYSTSDKRLKNIHKRPKFIDKLLSLGPVEEYDFTDEAKRLRRNTDNLTHYGLLYQNVKESVIPHAATEMEDGYGSVNYLNNDMFCILMGALRECVDEIKKLKKRLNDS